MDQKVVCRKCQGNHLTIKCGKSQDKLIHYSSNNGGYSSNNGGYSSNNGGYSSNNGGYSSNNGESSNSGGYSSNSTQKYKKYEKSFTIKISKLPMNITKKELEELLTEWGHVKNINVVVYETTATAFINFSTLDEATYFVKALNRTNFDNNFIYAVSYTHLTLPTKA